MNMDSIDTMVDTIANRVADIVWQRIEQRLNNKAEHPLTREQLMKQLDISPATLWRWEKQGKIKRAYTIGKRAYYYLPSNK